MSLPYTAALLLAGEAPSPARLRAFVPRQAQQEMLWVAADGGYHHAEAYQVTVSAIVGDFDSLESSKASVPLSKTSKAAEAPKQIRSHAGKDESDRNLALQYLADLGHQQVVQIGGGGQRSDHFLAMICDYRLRRLCNPPKLWLTRFEAIYYLKAGEQIELAPPSKLISTFPLEPQTALQSESLRWPLHSLDSPKAEAIGGRLPYSLSNWATAEVVQIQVRQGSALVFCPYSAS